MIHVQHPYLQKQQRLFDPELERDEISEGRNVLYRDRMEAPEPVLFDCAINPPLGIEQVPKTVLIEDEGFRSEVINLAFATRLHMQKGRKYKLKSTSIRTRGSIQRALEGIPHPKQ